MEQNDHDEEFPIEALIDFVIYAVSTFGPADSSGNSNPIGMPQWIWEDEEGEEAFSISLLDGLLSVWVESNDSKYQPVLQYAKECGLNVRSKTDG